MAVSVPSHVIVQVNLEVQQLLFNDKKEKVPQMQDSHSNSYTTILIIDFVYINLVSRNIHVKIISYCACFMKLKHLKINPTRP